MLSIINRQWDGVVTKLRERTTHQTYDSCLSRIKLLGWERDHIVVGVPTRFIKLYIERFFLDLIRQSIADSLAQDGTAASPNELKISIKSEGDMYGEFRKGMEGARQADATCVGLVPPAQVAVPPCAPAPGCGASFEPRS